MHGPLSKGFTPRVVNTAQNFMEVRLRWRALMCIKHGSNELEESAKYLKRFRRQIRGCTEVPLLLGFHVHDGW